MWNKYARCKCGWYERAPFGSKFHIHKEVCPCCGLHKDNWWLETAREMSDAVWWKPLTWLDAHLVSLEEKGGDSE